MQKNLSIDNYARSIYGINQILTESRQKSFNEREKDTDFEYPMKLRYLNSLVGNAKKLLANIYQSVKLGFQQKYPNKFCCKFNRRCFGEDLFAQLVITDASFRTDFEHKTYHKMV